jgi:hypothetical protein
MKNALIRIIIGIFPLALTPLLAFLISDGYLNFGGGEKDIILLIPWVIWSFLFLILFIITWIKKFSMKKSLIYSAAVSLLLIIAIWIVTFLVTHAG